MKKLFRNLVAAFACAALLYSCAPDDEGSPTTATPTDPKAKFIGTWSCQETAGFNPATYDIHVVDAGGSNVFIEAIYNTGFQNKVTAAVSGSSLTLAAQQIGTTNYQITTGSGTSQTNNTFTLSFSVDDGSSVDNVTATCTRK
jgi:hypothetical protein